MIEILTSGLSNSVQDLGRPCYLDQGIGWGGAMDRQALQIGNLLVGNEEKAAGIEVSIFPFRLRFHKAGLFAVTGAIADISIDGMPSPAWWARRADAGHEIRIDAPQCGNRIYLAFAGGIDVPQVLHSFSTDLKSGFGGYEGRGLKRGDMLSVFPSEHTSRHEEGHGVDPVGLGRTDANVVRIMPGAEFHRFTGASRSALFAEPFIVSGQNNRQGMRLEGAPLLLEEKLELFSHGIMPGTIQVPPSGQPVIQLAEANTCGGYPKISHVIPSDLWKLAQARAGSELRFASVDRASAIEALRRERHDMKRLENLMPIVIRS